MGPINIGVCHDNDAVIAQFIRVEFLFADTATQRSHNGAYFSRSQHFVEARFLDIKDLTFERQNRLIFAIAPLFRRSTRRITLHQVDL